MHIRIATQGAAAASAQVRPAGYGRLRADGLLVEERGNKRAARAFRACVIDKDTSNGHRHSVLHGFHPRLPGAGRMHAGGKEGGASATSENGGGQRALGNTVGVGVTTPDSRAR